MNAPTWSSDNMSNQIYQKVCGELQEMKECKDSCKAECKGLNSEMVERDEANQTRTTSL
jgi:hypothetical protein